MPLPVNYTTVTEVLRTLPAIGSISTVDSKAVHAFIGDSEAVINAKLSTLYTVPVAGTPPLLQVISTDLTIYRIMMRSFSGEQQNASEWLDRFKEASDLLRDIANGTIPLVNSAGTQIDGISTAEPWSNTRLYSPTFDVGAMETQRVSPDRLDDIEDARDE